MYVKQVKSKNHVYLKICESYRDKGKPRQRVLANLGRLDVLQSRGLEKVVHQLSSFLPNKNPYHKDISTMEEMARYNYGFVAYGKLWEMLGLTKMLRDITRQSKLEFDISKVVFSMVVNRLLEPSSKLYHFNHKNKYLGLNEELELHQIYRALDVLAENKEEIELRLFERQRDLFNLELDIVFYDVTTFYFESREVDELRAYGFSKDNKVNEVQVVMGLLIDKEGRPIGYELFRGNTFDSKTMIRVIKKLKEKFSIGRIIFVADRGVNTKINLKELKENGFDYCLSGRLRQMPEGLQAELLNREGYQKLSNGYEYKEVKRTNVVKFVDESGDRQVYPIEEKLVCTYSEERATFDRLERERLVKKAKEIVSGNEKWVVENKKGHKKYIEKQFLDGNGRYTIVIDEERIREDERFDGYYVVQSSDASLSAREIVEIYHNLWRIEESFRVLKSTMMVRPIFHWKPKRIEGHFVMCFLAFLLERELEARLKRNRKACDGDISPEKIKEALNSMEVSELEIEGDKFFLKGKHRMLGSVIFSVLKVSKLKNLNSFDDIKQRYGQFSFLS